MTTVEISRKRVVKALETEPLKNLKANFWIDEGASEDLDYIPKDCSVCAVGAVMRNILDPEQNASKVDAAAMKATIKGSVTAYGSRKDILENASRDAKTAPMSALSQVFEGLTELAIERTGYGESLSRHQMARIRKTVVAWAKKALPVTMQIDIDGAKPAKDVKVI